jgi:VanZ family protein
MNPVVLPELRYRRLWMLLGLLIALAIAIVCVVPSRSLPNVNLSDKLEHALAFLLLAFWFGSIIVRRDFLWLAVALVAFGGLIEIVQGTTGLGRHADPRDLLADSLGAGLGLLLSLTPLGRWTRWLEMLLARVRR